MPGYNSQGPIENPFIKSENKSLGLTATPASLNRSVTPPPLARPKGHIATAASSIKKSVRTKSAAAAVEASEIDVEDHVAFFSTKLLNVRLPKSLDRPRLTHEAWLDLYQRNLHDQGHHFVIHQHDHPIAGTHYDLRLQCNASSSISFAIMYGLPGDPNSIRPNRNATETRVHNLWNHLIETASADTGTMLLWDTGEYFVLPYNSSRSSSSNGRRDSSTSDSDGEDIEEKSEPEKLHRAFQARKIKLRLHGTKLPINYTIVLRLTAENNRLQQPPPPSFSRRRRNHSTVARKLDAGTSDSGHSSSQESRNEQIPENRSIRAPHLKHSVSSLHRLASPPARKRSAEEIDNDISKKKLKKEEPITTHASSSDTTAVQPSSADELIRLQNAYPGATNSINSIHQRKWYLSLDRQACGFTKSNDPETGQMVWQSLRRHGTDADEGEGAVGFQKFHVLGREHETSVLTGRKAADIARDEGLVGYRPRAGWRGITE